MVRFFFVFCRKPVFPSLSLPPLMVRRDATKRLPYASPYSKGRCRAERDGGDKSQSVKRGRQGFDERKNAPSKRGVSGG